MDPIEERNMPATAEAMAELFDDIDPSYFVEEGFDPTAYELNKMKETEEFDLDFLERERFKLKRQVQIVSKKVSTLIIQNSLGFSSQVKHYSSVQDNASEILQTIISVRSVLAISRKECRVSLAIVANHRKQKYLFYLKSALNTIKRLFESEYRLKELIALGDFATATKFCVTVIHEAEKYKQYACVRQVSKSLAKVLESMEFYIDDALAAQTVIFDVDRYCFIKSAYELLDKTERAAQNLQRFFRATIESSARSVLIEELKHSREDLKPDSMSYEELCQATSEENILSSCRELLCVLHKVLCLYHAFLHFHIEEDERLLSTVTSEAQTSSHCAVNENEFDAQPIVEKGVFQKSLTDNLYSIFKCAALKCNTLLCCCDLACLKFDQFIEVVEMSNKFRKFGRNHFGNYCVEVAITLEKQSNLYFHRYHAERMEELKMFLESEAFALCPVNVQFTLFDLPEFHFLKESSESFDDDTFCTSDFSKLCQVTTEHLEIGEQLDFTLISSTESMSLFPSRNEKNQSDSCNANVHQQTPQVATNQIRVVRSPNLQQNEVLTDEESCALERSSSDDSIYGSSSDGSFQDLLPNLCNTALNVLRFVGRYIRMTSILRSISESAIASIIELYKYFLYSIYTFFCMDFREIPQTELDFSTTRLRNLISSIHAEMIQPNRKSADGSSDFASANASEDSRLNSGIKNSTFIGEAKCAESVDLNDGERIYALAERIVAVESIIFLAKQLELLRPVLESFVKKKSKKLDDFYRNVLPVTVELRRCAYGAAMSRVLDYADLIKREVNVKWDVSDIQSQHNPYIDFILNECSLFKERLSHASTVSHISRDLNAQIWSILLQCIFRALVQGNSEASKKCSNEGRALMLLDFESLCGGLESISGLRPLPHKPYLENYIKAFYLPQDDLGEWIIHHTEYTVGQVTALLNANSSVTRKSKFSFMNILEGRDLLP